MSIRDSRVPHLPGAAFSPHPYLRLAPGRAFPLPACERETLPCHTCVKVPPSLSSHPPYTFLSLPRLVLTQRHREIGTLYNRVQTALSATFHPRCMVFCHSFFNSPWIRSLSTPTEPGSCIGRVKVGS